MSFKDIKPIKPVTLDAPKPKLKELDKTPLTRSEQRETTLEELVGFESDAWLDRYDALAEIYYAIDEKCGEDSVVSEERYKEIDADGVELTVACKGKKYRVTVLYRYTAVVASVDEVSGNAR